MSALFSELSPSPVAAASLGQVYRGRLRSELGGHEAAVKVCRPGVRESVALDLHVMRSVALAASAVPGAGSDWVGLLDEWAARFFDEMEYEREAETQAMFRGQMEVQGLLAAGIVVPEVYRAAPQVLVTEWIEGEKLAESTASDVRELCSTLLSCYLIQLLETGCLHSDPHPGNLLRTRDGKIAILDFGLVTQIAPDYGLALMEYIAHLSVSPPLPACLSASSSLSPRAQAGAAPPLPLRSLSYTGPCAL